MKNQTLAPNIVRLFGMTGLQITSELNSLQKSIGFDLGVLSGPAGDDKDDTFYPQFDQSVRAEAARMSRHYEIFYCLEKSIRSLIKEKLIESKGQNWWESIPSEIRKNAVNARQKEIDSGVTPRSNEPLDFTTFGELSVIINNNWDVFGDTLSSQKAVEKVMGSLNTLRSPIAHCSPLAEDEVLRLQITVRSWFRLME